MILIHTALKYEAKPLIEKFRLRCIQTKPFKIYIKDDIILAVCGMGAKNTLHVKRIFENYKINKAFNIGIAGCKDTSVKIGSLFTCKKNIFHVDYASLTSVNKSLGSNENLKTMLVDMEAEMFLHVSKKHLHVDDIYILKIVSDHLDTTIPKKEFVWKIIEKNLKIISAIIISQG